MSPELLQLYSKSGFGEFNPEKSDIFSTGITFIRLAILLYENQIANLNDLDKAKYLVFKLLKQIDQ